ncbi:tetratricopeptide repeat protein [Stenotrophomonas sp. NPDC077464]|uniref:tetratricopeptide repeat protein n=1 Tax=unclassified Stenotrophomonas TaxID=196198 RepID=UPI0037D5F8FA
MSAWMQVIAGLCAAVVAMVVLWPLRSSGKRAPFVAAVIAIGVAGVALYLLVGTPKAMDVVADEGPTTLQQGVRELEQALEREPQRADGWALLGRSELALGNPDKANQAFTRAVGLAPDEVPVLVEAAQARAQTNADKRFDDTALQWLRHAQQLEPGNERAGWLIGIALRQRGQDAEAAAVWEALLPRLEPAAAAALREQIAIAREKAGMPALAGADPHSVGLDIEVTLDPASAGKALPAGMQVFVIARVPGGPPMPVAVEKHPATALPLKIRLDDADSPMPTAKLSSLKDVEVFARLSASGTASRQEGDVDSEAVRVTLPHEGTIRLAL